MKKVLLGVMLFAGVGLGFASNNNSSLKKNKIKKIVEGNCVRCYKNTTTIIDADGNTSTSTVQFCYTVPCL